MALFFKNKDFLKSEFKAMDEDEDGLLSREEVYQMMIYQGVEMSEEKIEEQLKTLRKPVDLKCFIRFMNKLPDRTRKLREIFAIFTEDKSSMEATNEEVLRGLEKLGVHHRQKLVDEMINAENIITYKDFARICFKAKDLFS